MNIPQPQQTFVDQRGIIDHVWYQFLNGLSSVTSSSGTGTVTLVSLVLGNGILGGVSTASTTPVISLTLGNVTALSVSTPSITATNVTAASIVSSAVSVAKITAVSISALTITATNVVETNLSSGNITAQNIVANTVTTGRLVLSAATVGALNIIATATTSSYTITLPSVTGTVSQLLQTDGTGITSWATASGLSGASQAQMESATTTAVAVTPLSMNWHPAIPKFFAYITVTGGTPTLAASWNVTSITDLGVGNVRVTIATDFSSSSWGPSISCDNTGINVNDVYYQNVAAGTVDGVNLLVGVATADPLAWTFSGQGDQ